MTDHSMSIREIANAEAGNTGEQELDPTGSLEGDNAAPIDVAVIDLLRRFALRDRLRERAAQAL